ncbi:Hsp20/alpha crystallin family protein [Acidiphilium sp.]|uniref:Hsp20/alpha crystallin family protein n=1 Tax=Acidiphilium sp. TaxID=527 RepID=UPI002582F061|nr:Hsp20/alpha crystallin family protein [Acidiphilium sp.]
MARFADPFETILGLQQALEDFRSSNWLSTGISGGGSFPPVNVFKKGDDFVVITEVPGVRKTDLNIQIKGRTIQLSGIKSTVYPENASFHRRECLQGDFDRAITLPVEIAEGGVKAECRDGILALYLPRAEHDKPRSIHVN